MKHLQHANRTVKALATAIAIVATALFFLAMLLSYAVDWVMRTYADPKVDEIIFMLKVPLQGANQEYVVSFMGEALVPALLCTVLFAAVLVLGMFAAKVQARARVNTRRQGAAFVMPAAFLAVALISAGGSVQGLFDRTDLGEYVQAQTERSTLIEDEYVDPQNVELTFPEEKRNLIYIFLESMESTYYSTRNGGFYETGFMPELEQLALESVTFGEGDGLEGLHPMYGTTWTMGAMVAHTSGLPLKIPIDGNSYGEYSSFLPGIVTLGQILEDEGYEQELMVGSDASFGGRSSYFSQHGDYRIFDLQTAYDEGLMTPEEKVWWGFEDKDLFAYAKKEILELAAQDAPFNFTLLTVDTHADEGWVCDLCEDEFDEQLANVVSCSSSLVVDFVRWAQQQDFYEDTTIVIAGDHLSMQACTFDDMRESDYERTVMDIIVNPAARVSGSRNRSASTMDLFPTTLAAMGVRIEGDRLGLGTNLFSLRQTLLEEYGKDYVEAELRKSSTFYDERFVYADVR